MSYRWSDAETYHQYLLMSNAQLIARQAAAFWKWGARGIWRDREKCYERITELEGQVEELMAQRDSARRWARAWKLVATKERKGRLSHIRNLHELAAMYGRAVHRASVAEAEVVRLRAALNEND